MRKLTITIVVQSKSKQRFSFSLRLRKPKYQYTVVAYCKNKHSYFSANIVTNKLFPTFNAT